nr:hypothetical protein [Tanacetum cinerariifolium]
MSSKDLHNIYDASSKNRPPMLNKENYVPWSSRIIRYARSRLNDKMIVDSIENRPYVRRMIATPGEPDLPVPVPKSFHKQTDEELTETDIKRMDTDDQAIQTILLGLLEDVYAAVDSCETAKEIWERVRQMMKGSDIREQEKKAKLFNEWEKFMSTDEESIESYYHQFMQLMNDLKRNKHFLENIASNLKFLNNLQPEWKRHVTIVRQTKNIHKADFTQIYDFLKMNQDENGGNQNGLVVVPGIANQSGSGNVVADRAEGTGMGNQAREFNVVKHRSVIAPEMFKINPSQTPRVDLVPNKQSSTSIRTNPITNSQRHVIVKENVSSNTVTTSSIGLVHTAKTKRPQPKGNTRNARIPSVSKSSEVKKNVTVKDHHRTLLLSKN